MAKYIAELKGDFDAFTKYVEREFLCRKLFSELKHQFKTKVNEVRCCVQVFEGFSFKGGNWLTVTITTLEFAGKLKVVAMVTGGSGALLLKNLSFGVETEKKVAETVKEIIDTYHSNVI